MTTKRTCPACNREVESNPPDPATALTVRDFLRWSHALDPEKYHATLKKYPVDLNVQRDQGSHEVLMDFRDEVVAGEYSDGEDSRSYDRNQRAILALNRRMHREWLNQQFQ